MTALWKNVIGRSAWPRTTLALSWRERRRVWRNEVEKAAADLDHAFRLDPTNPSGQSPSELKLDRSPLAAFARAVCALAGPGSKRASDALAARSEPRIAAEYVARGKDWYQKQDFNKAIADFDAAIEREPGLAAAYAARARAWAKKHYRERELADLSRAVDLEPENVTYRVARAESWSGLGQHSHAMGDYAEALRLAPANPSVWVSRGEEWRKDLKVELAIADFTQAIRLDPRYAPAYVARANTWKQIQRFDLAIEGFSELIRIDPENAIAHQSLGRILATCHVERIRNGRRALDEAFRACELTHWRTPDSLDTLAAAYAELRDFQSAVKWQIEAIKLLRQNIYSELHEKSQRMSGGARSRIGFEDRLAFYRSKKPIRE